MNRRLRIGNLGQVRIAVLPPGVGSERHGDDSYMMMTRFVYLPGFRRHPGASDRPIAGHSHRAFQGGKHPTAGLFLPTRADSFPISHRCGAESPSATPRIRVLGPCGAYHELEEATVRTLRTRYEHDSPAA